MILDNKLATAEEIKKLETECRVSVDEAVVKAQGDAEPPLTELFTDITDDKVGTSI